VTDPSLPRRPHLRAFALAALASALVLTGGAFEGARLVNHSIHALAPVSLSLKNQGLALQRTALHQPDLLPLYGSSELVKPIPDKAARFFRRYPTDFEVSPIGKAGTTSLIILQKLGALGEDLRGKKIAISLSPTWFMTPEIPPHYYAGNFSRLQADEFIFYSDVSTELKTAVAKRMLDYPETMGRDGLLRFALQRLAGGSRLDRVLLAFIAPFGRLDAAILRAQDEFETAFYIYEQGRLKNPHRLPHPVDWEMYLTHAAFKVDPEELRQAEPGGDWQRPGATGDAHFLTELQTAREWHDFDLLLRVLHETGAQPLLLSMPFNSAWFDRIGVSPAAREEYRRRLHAAVDRYGFPLRDFVEHDDDPRFLADHHDHLSVEGWMYYNRALDEFFHGRTPQS
jgi:D-alanine transfer protein